MELHPSSKESAIHVFDGKPKLDQRKVSKQNRRTSVSRLERMAAAQRAAARQNSIERRRSSSTDSTGEGRRRSGSNERPRSSADYGRASFH